MIREIAADINRGGDPGEISGRFHYTVADIIVQTVSRIRKDSGIGAVAISGGTFQNRIVSRLVENMLMDHGFSIYIPEKVPANDGGIALGQLAVAAVRRDH